MRLLVWLLLLLNVLLLGYFKLSVPNEAGVQPGHEPLQAEKIKLLTPQEIEALPKRSAQVKEIPAIAPTPVQYNCYEWGSFSATNLPKARNILAKFSLNATTEKQNPQEAARYWVYIPRQKSLQEAEARVGELHGLGVDESFVVMEPQWRYAISLGVFKDEQSAVKLLDELKTKGVDSAVKGVRNQEKGRASLLISSMSSDTAAEIDKLKPEFPGSELKQVACQ
jgi:hypothetical protein